jgi:hypothetical protein
VTSRYDPLLDIDSKKTTQIYSYGRSRTRTWDLFLIREAL